MKAFFLILLVIFLLAGLIPSPKSQQQSKPIVEESTTLCVPEKVQIAAEAFCDHQTKGTGHTKLGDWANYHKCRNEIFRKYHDPKGCRP